MPTSIQNLKPLLICLALTFILPFTCTLTYASEGAKFEPAVNLNPVQVEGVEVSSSGKEILPGQTVELKLKLKIDQGFHAYLDQYKLDLIDSKDYYLSEFQIRPTVKFTDPITKKEKIGTLDYAEMLSLLDIPKNAPSGLNHINLELTYQACGKDFCLFPKKIIVPVDFKIAGSASNLLTQALEKGWVYALILVFFAGLLTSFTPCIFPMIPITMAVLGTTSHRSKLKGFITSLFYVFGIAITYALLGVLAAKTGALFGSLLGHPLVVGAVAFLFVLMGLSMYGLFEIKLPNFITNKIAGSKTEKNMIGAFLSGLIAGVVASPCVGPVLISVLAYVAQTQNTLAGFVLLFTFALGLGQLFLIIGTFNSLIHRLPKSGPWMEQVKFIFGSIMIGMALYYIYPVVHSALFDGLVATALIGISIYFGAFKKSAHPKTSKDKAKKALMTMLFIFGLIFSIKSLLPTHIQKQFFTTGKAETSNANILKPEWFSYSDELLQKANREGRPVIIDFHAEWCLSCKELALYTFSDPRVIELGKQFIWLEFDATSPSDQLSELQARYNIGGLPFVVIYNSRGTQDTSLTLTGFESADLFLKRMQAALTSSNF